MAYDNAVKSRNIKASESAHKRIVKTLSTDKIVDILNSTKSHEASKWGRRYVCQKLSHCESISRTDRRYIKSKNNRQLVELAIRHLGFDDWEFKKLNLKSKSNAGYLLYFWKLKSQVEKIEQPCVYVIGNEDFVKVGFSKDVTKRLKSIQTGCPYPLQIIKVFNGLDKESEKMFHVRLRQWRTHGEWFKRCREVERILEIST